MKNILLLPALFGFVAAASAFPTWEPFTNQTANSIGSAYPGANGGIQLANQTNASGEKWYQWTGTTTPVGVSALVTNFNLGNITLNGYTLPAPLSPPPTNAVFVPNNILSNGNGACIGFSKAVFPPAGKVSKYGAATTNRFFVSFLIDVANSAGLNNGGNPTYYAGIISSGLVQGNYNGTPPGAPSPQFRFNVGASASVTPYGLGVQSANGATFTGGAFQNAPYEQSNQVYFVVIDYEFAGTNVSNTVTNDQAHMWINPTQSTFGAATQPAVNTAAAGVSIAAVAADVLTNAGGFYILARDSSNNPTNGWYVGAMSFGTTWSYVTGGAELTSQPASVNASGGQTLILTSSATAIAGQTISYQWAKNGNNLSDGPTGNGSTITGSQTSPNLTISGLAEADAGSYTVSVTTPVSQANNTPLTSSNAVVTVDPLIVSYTTNITVLGGSTGNLIVTNTTLTSGLTYQWQRNGVSLGSSDGTGTTYSGVQSSNLTLANISTSDSGNNGVSYYCVVSNALGGFVTNGPMTLTVQSLVVSQPTPASVNANYGATVSFSASSIPAGSSYQWLLNGSPVSDPNATGTTTTTLTINGVSYIDDGSYTLFVNGQYTSVLPAVLTVNDPYIVTQPVSQTVNAGSTVTYLINAPGSPTVAYQWNSNGIALSDVPGVVTGSSTSALTLSSVADADDASYNVTITSGSGSGGTTNSAAATLTVVDPATLIAPMNSWTVNPGVHIAFAPSVSGTPPFTYQWYYDGNPLVGATSSNLVLTDVQSTTNGTYSVNITNNIVGGTANTTASATLTVTPTPITMPVANLIVARVGDGSQTLNTTQGNTLYLDQFTGSGSYVATTMIPDSGPQALVVAGGTPDGLYEGGLTASTNNLYLDFCGFNVSLPNTNVSDLGSGSIRSIGAISALGNSYVLAVTNIGLHSGGNQFRSVASTDGLFSFWSIGVSGGIQYITPTSNPNGQNIVTVTPSAFSLPDLRVLQFLSNNAGSVLYFSGGSNEASGSLAEIGLFDFPAGTPTTVASSISVFENPNNGGNQNYDANDFAISPDGGTIYIADDNTIANSGGIQRWDGGSLSYVLLTGNNSSVGARGVVVNWGSATSWGSGVTGETVYATTAETSGNRLIEVVDNGSGSTATTLQTAGPNQIFRGVRFGLNSAPPSIVTQPQTQTVLTGTIVTFSVQAAGSSPFSYQWWSNGVSVPFATNSTFVIPDVQPNAGGGTGYYVVVNNGVNPSVTSQTVTLTVLTEPPTISSMQSWTVGANTGVRVVFAPVIGGSLPDTITWTSNGVTLPDTGTSLTIANPTVVGGPFTYEVTVANAYGPTVSATATLTVLAQAPLSTANLVVARVGDGLQTLNTNNGNTLYMDQFQPGGAYVSTLMIPDSGTTPCIVAGGAPDGMLESVLTSSSNNLFLNFAGYSDVLPNSIAPTTDLGSGTIRVIGAVSGTGYYTRAVTNIGLYSAGIEIRSAASPDGLINFWTTGGGLTSSPGIKYINPTADPNGQGIPEVASAGPTDTRVVQVISNSSLGANFAYTTGQSGAIGLYLATGALETAATVVPVITEGSGSPDDFAVSPDLQTIYIADDSVQPAGGIQRWDTNTSSSGYSLSYTLVDTTVPNATNGMRGLTVNWGSASSWGSGVTGEQIFATTAEATTNRLVAFADNGSGSADTALATASPNEVYRGIRFGPATVPLSILTNPVTQSAIVGQTVDFTVVAAGTTPYYYQWYTNGVAVPGATGSDYSIASVQMSNAASYTVTVNNGVSAPATSAPAVLTVNPFGDNSDLVGWWRFNDGSGTTAADSSGYNDPGALDNFPASPWVAGLDNAGALDFANADANGDNAVVVPDAPQLNFSNNLAFTLAAWVNSASAIQTQGAGLIAKGYGAGGEQYSFDLFTNAGLANPLRFYVHSATGATVLIYTTSSLVLGQWEHVAATYDGNEGVMAVYVNGQQVGLNTSAPNSLIYTALPVTIGNRPKSATNNNDLPFLGQMQDVRIYDVALGAQDIQSLYLYQNLAAAASPSQITTTPAPSFVGAGQFQLNLSGVPNTPYRLWSSTDVALTPVATTWTLVTSGTFNSSGTATYTDTSATTTTRYYVITQP